MSHSFSNRAFRPKIACPTMAFWFAFLIACLVRNAAAAGESPPKPVGKLALDCLSSSQVPTGRPAWRAGAGERRSVADRRAAEQPRSARHVRPAGFRQGAGSDALGGRVRGQVPDLRRPGPADVGRSRSCKATLADVVRRLCDLQAEDGYLGPWPKAERLRGQWDLWGHYHIILGLRMWSEQTGDARAAATAREDGRPGLQHVPGHRPARVRRRLARDEHGDHPRRWANCTARRATSDICGWPAKC